MPKGTRVHKCVEKLVKVHGTGFKPNAIRICQSSTNQSYKTGKKPKKT